MRAGLALVLVALIAGVGAWWATKSAPARIAVVDATLVPAPDGTLALFATITSQGAPDILRSVSVEGAAFVHLMGDTGVLAIPAGGTPALAADGAHAMVMGLEGPLDPGRLVPVTLAFAQAGPVVTRARITEPGDPHAMHGGAQGADGTGIELSMAVSANADGGWTVTAQAAGFVFAQPDDSAVDVPVDVLGEGHGHLYLNGLKLQRYYGGPATIGALPPGEHLVTLVLNTNTHRPYLRGGSPVMAQARITAP